MSSSSEMDLPFDSSEDSGATLASNVLVVDDEAVVRDIFARLLAREADLVISNAETAEQALELLQEQRFELLITDKNLPGMGGVELISRARTLRPGLEAIMITGYATPESVLAAMAAGASDYLVKPFDDLRVVRAKIRSTLERREEHARSRRTARNMARQAAELLRQGRDAPEPAWRKLEAKLREYEQAAREGGTGVVLVVGGASAVAVLTRAGFSAEQVGEASPLLHHADVVVIETGTGDWRTLAERLQSEGADVLLLAGPDADLADLLEAISLRVDLIGFGGQSSAQALPERVRAVFMRRVVEKAQESLSIALLEFREALRESQPR